MNGKQIGTDLKLQAALAKFQRSVGEAIGQDGDGRVQLTLRLTIERQKCTIAQVIVDEQVSPRT